MTDASATEVVAPPVPVVAGSLGVLGGTFDPIHHGHLAIAEEAREVLGLERVLFVPAAVSPFKTDGAATDAEHRLAMVEAAIAGNPSFACSRIEVDRPGPSYSVDTLRALSADGTIPGGLWFVLSSEALSGLPRWREPAAILDVARLAVVPRAGFDRLGEEWAERVFPGRDDRFTFLSGPLLPISGSVIRQRAAAGRSVRYLVPDAVARYIAQHRLYREPV